MRRLLGSLILVVSGTVLGCGGDDPGPLFADLQWQVRCQCMGMCSGIPPRDINHIDGEDGHRVVCELNKRGDVNILTASAYQGNDYGLEIRGAEFTASGGPVSGAGCRVTVKEGGNTYVGACGAGQPSTTQPCRVSQLTVGSDMDGNPEISGKILCINMPAQTDAATLRELTFPNSRIDSVMCVPLDTTEAASFRFVNCRGL